MAGLEESEDLPSLGPATIGGERHQPADVPRRDLPHHLPPIRLEGSHDIGNCGSCCELSPRQTSRRITPAEEPPQDARRPNAEATAKLPEGSRKEGASGDPGGR
eukprot:167700-Alexandrium_andersonii.AAC.1